MDFSILVVILQLLVGGKDAASLVDSTTWWRQLGVDPRTAPMMAVLAEPVTPTAERPITTIEMRRLMALAQLAKLRDRQALPVLESLLESPRRFEADYARAAIASIQNRPPLAITPKESRLADWLSVLPADASGVLHASPIPQSSSPAMASSGIKINVGGVNLTTDGDTGKQTLKLTDILANTGNFRIDAAALALCMENDGVPRGTMLLQGQFDSERLLQAFTGDQPATPVTRDGFTTVSLNEGHLALAVLAPDLVLIGWDRPRPEGFDLDATLVRARRVLQGSGIATEGPDAGLPGNAEVMALLAPVPRTGPLWGAAIMPEKPFWGGDWAKFHTVTLQTTAQDGSCTFLAHGTGPDTTGLTAFRAESQQSIDEALQEWSEGLGQLPIGFPVTNFLKSMEFGVEGESLTATGTLGPQLIALLPIAAVLFKPKADADDDEPAPEAAAPATK